MANEEILELQIRDNAGTAAAALTELATALAGVKNAIGKGLNIKGTVSGLEKLKNAVNNGLNEESLVRFERLAAVLEKLKSVGGLKITGLKSIANSLNASGMLGNVQNAAQDAIGAVGNAAETITDVAEQRTAESAAAMQNEMNKASIGVSGILASLREVISTSNLSGGRLFSDLATSAKSLVTRLSEVAGGFLRIAKYRFIRFVIKQITEAFSTGIKNVYNYSKAIKSSFATSMDEAASSLAQFKNSLGAATAPLLEMLIPYLKIAVNWLIEMINYLNQFLALANGQTTWTRALYKSTSAFDDQAKKSKKASSAIKELLADWDELNIIQNESGGAGAAGDAAEDYTTMFEEVSEFDNYLKDHFDGILDTVKKIGAAILTWRLSNIFSGALSSLFRLATGGLLIGIGIDFAYRAGFEIGSTGEFSTSSLIKSIVGSLATAVGGTLIATAMGFSGVAGFGIGLTIGVIATLVGYIRGRADFMDKMKWGNVTLTSAQIKQFVQSRFKFDVNSEITVLGNNIINREEAKKNLDLKISEFATSLKTAVIKFKLKADDTTVAINDAYTSAQEALSEVQKFIDTNSDALKVTLSVSPIKNAAGEDITEDVLSQITIADTTLKQYFINLGKELADAVYQGEKDGWTEGEMATVLSLMEHQRNILQRANELNRDLEFQMDYSFNLRNLTRDNAKEVFEAEKELINQYKEKFIEDRASARQAAIQQLAYTMTAIEDYKAKGLDTTELEQTAATYQQLIADYLDPEKAEKAWEEKMEQSIGAMRQDWIDALTGVYGITDTEFTENRAWLLYKSPNEEFTNNLIDASKSKDPIGEAKKALGLYFDTIKKSQPDYIQDMMDTLNFNVWDIANDEVKKNLIAVMRDALGDDYAAAVLQGFKIPIDEIERLFGDEYKYDPLNLKPKVEPVVEETNEYGRPWWDILGLTYTSPDMPITTYIDGLEIVLTNEDEIMQQVKDQVQAAMNNGQMEDFEADFIINLYGEARYKQALEELQYNLDEEGYNRGRMVYPLRHLASAGMSDVSYGGYTSPSVANSGQTDEQMYNNIERGMKSANEPQNSILRTIEMLTRQIAQKDFTINVTPTSAWGQHNAKSKEIMEKVTGYSYTV